MAHGCLARVRGWPGHYDSCQSRRVTQAAYVSIFVAHIWVAVATCVTPKRSVIKVSKNVNQVLSFGHQTAWLGAESNRRHVDFQSTALPTELPSRDDAPTFCGDVGGSLCRNPKTRQHLVSATYNERRLDV